MISDQKILVTGATGSVGLPLARHLAEANEVWGLARLDDPAKRSDLEALGITPVGADLAAGDLDEVPDDFTYVVHLAWARGDLSSLHQVLRVNAEGTGLLLQHCRAARAALVMSSSAIYSPNLDLEHAYSEDDPVGQTVLAGMRGSAATSPASKLAMEAVARFCAVAFELPVVIARLNTFAGVPRSLPGMCISTVRSGQPFAVPCDPYLHSPIDVEDMKHQLEPLLDAAATPALTVNWCGDGVIAAQEWATLAAGWSGTSAEVVVTEPPTGPKGNVADPTRRRSITGPCQVAPEESFRRLYDTMA